MLDAVLLAVKEQRANPGDMTMLVCMSGFISGAAQIRDDTFDVPLSELLTAAAAKEGA